ncbi:MAG: dTDP-4-dehydrorhamnose reductase [Acidimicrobiaceae bacterium]|nr:dTDP-4-dehydrorhamnose reductase [Acidimicrobiaceae bacterium]
MVVSSTRTVVIVGAAGQLGRDLVDVWRRERPEDRLAELAHADLEIADLASVRQALLSVGPQLVLNAAAYNLVDRAEEDSRTAFEANAIGPRNLALAAQELGAVLVHVSSDYVFSGTAHQPYIEGDPVDPRSVYGVSKAAGEMLVRATTPRHFVVRTSGLYGQAGSGGKGGNFVDTMLRLAEAGQPIRVVDDQVLTPTCSVDLAMQILRLAATDAYGTYHATCQGQCSWYAFAAEIFHLAGLNPLLQPQTTPEAGRPAARPPYSVLDNRGLRELGIDLMPDWQDALGRYLSAKPSRP